MVLLQHHSMQRKMKISIRPIMRCCSKALRAIKMGMQERRIYMLDHHSGAKICWVSSLLGTITLIIIVVLDKWTVMVTIREHKEWNIHGWISCRVARTQWIIRRVDKRHSGMRRIIVVTITRGVFRILIVVVNLMLVLFVHCRRRLDSFKGNWMNRECVWMISRIIYRRHRSSIPWRCRIRHRNRWSRLRR